MQVVKTCQGFLRNRLSAQQIRRLRPLQTWSYSLLFGRNLKRLALLFGTDKHDGHWYVQHYEKFFAPLRRKRLKILEIGIGGDLDPRAGGTSLRMWKSYFPRSEIYGIDIQDKTWHQERRITTFKGSQADAVFLRQCVEAMGRVDIVIDDGSHQNEHVLKSFEVLFPLLSENGIYSIEDTQTSYWASYGGSSHNMNAVGTMMAFFKGLTDGLNYQEFQKEYVPSYTDQNIFEMHFYHNLLVIQKGLNCEPGDRLWREEDARATAAAEVSRGQIAATSMQKLGDSKMAPPFWMSAYCKGRYRSS